MRLGYQLIIIQTKTAKIIVKVYYQVTCTKPLHNSSTMKTADRNKKSSL